MSDTDKSELIDLQIEHCINELIGIVKHTESFNDEPEKKARQLARNKVMATKTKQTIKALITQQCKDAQIEIIDYTMRKPTGELTMTVEEMKATSDAGWRDEVIQYFFNTESLMFNLLRKKEELQKKTKEVK